MDNSEVDVGELLLYTDITFKNDDVTVILKNVDLEMLSRLNDKILILEDILFGKWYMHGVYDVVDVMGYKFVIVNKTKKKVEMIRAN